MMKFGMKSFAVATLVVGLGGASANAATITLDIENIPMTTLFGQLKYDGNVGDILGFYSGGTLVPPASAPLSTTKAERYASGDNEDESNLVKTLSGLSVVNLGSSTLPMSGSSTTVASNSYFTTKFGTSLAVFWNTTALDILVTFDSSNETCPKGNGSSQCGGISHFKAVSTGGGGGGAGGPTTPVPLPAGLPLILSGLGVFGLLKLRSRKAA